MLRSLLRALTVTLLLAGSIPLQAEPPRGERLFVTAHSFHIFTASGVTSMAKAAGITEHRLVGSQMLGGSRVKQHWDLPDEKNQAKKALLTGNVDVLTMSPNMTVPDEGIDLFVELGLKANPKLRVLLQESWIPWDGWLPDEKVKANADRDTRNLDTLRKAGERFKTAIEKQVKEINAKHQREVITIIPVTDAVLKLREMLEKGKVPGITRQSELFTDPIGHGQAPIRALASYCLFACLYRTSPEGLKDPQPELAKLSPDLQPLLQRIAWEAVTTHPMSGVKAPSK